ncbi:peptidoglycan-binding protein [bacterium]|nr:peptidoglycan-binding protein [bacterium]
MRTAAVFLIALILIPAASSAQTAEELQTKINALLSQIKALQDKISGAPAAPASATPVGAVGCPAIARTLSVGARGSDVTALQDFLRAKGYMSDASTGYFGAITEAAIKKLQAANGVVSSGSAATTGYGAVGPKTRSVILTLCSGVVSTPVTTTPVTANPQQQCAQVTTATAPNISCGGTWERMMNNTCHIGWRCVVAQGSGNKAPVITGITGPTEIGVGEFRSWQVQATDPEGGALTYNITWGDEGFEDILKTIAGISGTFTSVSTGSHSYAKAGTYAVQVTVKDVSGATAVGALSVKVTSGSVSANTSSNPLNPTASLASTTSAAACITPWGNQVVASGATAVWQPFFTEGVYLSTTSPIMKCDNGGWQKCSPTGTNCQNYTHPTSTPETAALPSYATQIGGKCSPEGSTKKAQVPPGTQLCQWLTCRTTTVVETITLKCTHSGWTDYAGY